MSACGAPFSSVFSSSAVVRSAKELGLGRCSPAVSLLALIGDAMNMTASGGGFVPRFEPRFLHGVNIKYISSRCTEPTRGTLSPALALGPDCWTRWNAEIVTALCAAPITDSLSLSLSPILAATFMPPRGHPTLVVLSPVASSSVASLSSASFCDAAAACRSLVPLRASGCAHAPTRQARGQRAGSKVERISR